MSLHHCLLPQCSGYSSVIITRLGESLHCAVLSRSVLSDSLWPSGPQPARLLCPWGFSRQEYCSGLPCPPPRDLPNSGIEPWCPVLQAILYQLSDQNISTRATLWLEPSALVSQSAAPRGFLSVLAWGTSWFFCFLLRTRSFWAHQQFSICLIYKKCRNPA